MAERIILSSSSYGYSWVEPQFPYMYKAGFTVYVDGLPGIDVDILIAGRWDYAIAGDKANDAFVEHHSHELEHDVDVGPGTDRDGQGNFWSRLVNPFTILRRVG